MVRRRSGIREDPDALHGVIGEPDGHRNLVICHV